MTRTSAFPLSDYTVVNAVQLGLIERPADADALSVADAMAEHSVHCVIIRGIDGDGWGIVSDLDLMAAMTPELAGATAGEIAATDVVIVKPTDTLEHAAQLMADHQTSHLVVVEPGTGAPVGILSTLDIARFATA